ncbi:hypothetical protein, partial [Mesorhizobium sp.]|uniref:hypothetical protein n=1 Tax=Mesorhizobium sp. TaxID=1871066 RepID=UPI0025C4541A
MCLHSSPACLFVPDYRERRRQAAWKIATERFQDPAGNIRKQISFFWKPSAMRRSNAAKEASYPPGIRSTQERIMSCEADFWR